MLSELLKIVGHQRSIEIRTIGEMAVLKPKTAKIVIWTNREKFQAVEQASST